MLNKERQAKFLIKNAEIRYSSGFILLKRDLLHLKGQNKVRLGIYLIKNAKISYGWGFTSLKMLK